MLLLIDLDNTLIDRAAAFKTWADSRFGRSFGPDAVSWVIDADRDGHEPREELVAVCRLRPGVRSVDGGGRLP